MKQRKSAKNTRVNIMLDTSLYTMGLHGYGNLSQTISKALQLYLEFGITVYVIKNRTKKECAVGIYMNDEPFDVAYHYAHSLGSNSLGAQIRDNGIHTFQFEILGKFKDLKEALLFKKIVCKRYEKDGFSFPYTCLDDSILLHHPSDA